MICSDENHISLPSGDTIYGRVMVDPVQNLGDSFICNIEKVFLCTGADGYVPKYNPTNFEFGCLADAPSLLYRFKIIVSNKNVSVMMSHVLCVHSNLNIPPCVIKPKYSSLCHLLTPGQGPARNPGQIIWQCSFQRLPGGGWPQCFSSSETTWVRWFQNRFLSSLPGQYECQVQETHSVHTFE